MSGLLIRSLFLKGPAGLLEALLNQGSTSATHSAVVCHPHPRYGGTLHNKVVFHAMKALNGFGFPVLRFNFRSAGLSHGEHDEGRGEVDDVRAALQWMGQEFGLPLVFAGFSFGAAVGLRAACPHPNVAALISLGTPVVAVDEGLEYDFTFLQSCTRPKLFVSGTRDKYGPRPVLERVVKSVPEPKNLVLIEGADHFFAGRLFELRHTIEHWIKDTLAVHA